MARVIVGMSGGVDSAVAAYLLKEQGYDVIGLTLRTWLAEDGSEGRCCEIDDARRIAWKLDIPYYPLNCRPDFKTHVTDPFVRDYLRGLTPNPCIECNRYVKWERMLYFARVLMAEYVATGHYAYVRKLENGRLTVQKASHAEKDQTYMLYKLTQEQLRHTLMPLGGYSKEEVRQIAKDAGIPVAEKPDSQEICFVPDGNYTDYIAKCAGDDLPMEGRFIDAEGKVLGTHKGITHYTVGQRRGLGLAMGRPVYVTKIDPDKNEVVVGDEDALYRDTVFCRDMNFMGIPRPGSGEKFRCAAKIRYHHPAQEAQVTVLESDRIKIEFDHPVKAPAPGQSAVLYDAEGCVLGGGIII